MIFNDSQARIGLLIVGSFMAAETEKTLPLNIPFLYRQCLF